MLLADALDSSGFAHQQLGEFLTTFGRHNRPVAFYKLSRCSHRIDASPCSLKGWVASVHKRIKKRGFFRPSLRSSSVLGCDGTQPSSQLSLAASYKLTLVAGLVTAALQDLLSHWFELAMIC